MNSSYVFFRNDDVRKDLDLALQELTDIFIKYRVPVSHAIEPANVSQKVVQWLLDLKQKNPGLIEIIQHGYDHKIKNIMQRGEFGGERTYEEQFMELKKGKELMDNYFGDQWFSAFTFPYSPFNRAAITALNDCNFKVLSTNFDRNRVKRVFYLAGHVLNKGLLWGHRVSWNLKNYPKTNLFVIDVNISFIRKYIDAGVSCVMNSLDFMINETKKYSAYKTIGILLHHRYHNTGEKIKLVEDYLNWIMKQKYNVSTFENIYRKFSK